ncbi:MAG: efflux RND transporter permease subunit [Gammaproteobacteria bacterium]|nr:efflux RND transporter permease subunit [Gammaproteobacteria bacterium]MDH4315820.1 efflux RND transporter permease subunit [Gammaproteobacteria bacterium]MDH5215254.1 efflux RND transporter permease subunit [Gammaproteobacteria bacterium]
MQLPTLSIQRPVLATVMNLVILLIGLICYERLAVRLIPNVDEPIVSVFTGYPGANAQVIESQITKPIEDALSGIEGIDYIRSISRAEESQVTVRFRLDRDADAAASDVRDRVAQARGSLPQEADDSIVQKQEADAQPIIYLAFSSDRHDLIEIADIANRLVKDRIQTIPGVAEAQVYGNRYAMRIWLDPDRLAGYELSPDDIEAALRAQNIETPAGRVESSEREFTVLAETDLREPQQFANIVVKETDRFLVRLGDVARIELGADSSRFRARFNGRNAVPLGIVKQAVANPLDISKELKVVLPEITHSLPEGMKVEMAFDSTVFIESSINEVFVTVLEAILLVVLVIFLFLRNWRAVLVPIVTIPVSLIGAFALMYLFGFTINTLSLLAMVLAIGLVVDDAIVMLENIYRHIEEGMEPMKAALTGSREIAFAIVAMTITLAAVYLPFAFSTGRSGKLFIEFALTLAGAVIVSGFTALTLSPMMCSKLLRQEKRHGALFAFGERLLRGLDRGYHGLLDRLLSRKWIVLGAAAGIIGGMLALFMSLPEELAPEEDQGFIIGFGTAPEGSTIEYTDRYAQELEGYLQQVPERVRHFGFTGFNGVTNVITFVGLQDWAERERSAGQIAQSLFPQFMGIAGLMAFPVTPPPLGQHGFGQPVSFVVQSTLTWDELGEIVQRLLVKMAENPRLTNPDTDLKLNKPELKIDINREKVSAVGASVGSVGRTLETMLGGRNVTRFKRGSEQYDVIVQIEDRSRRTPGDLSNIFVRGTNDQMVQLQNLATITEDVAAKELNHFNKLRSATVTAGLAPGYPLGEALDWMDQALAEVAPEALYDLSGQSREFRESASSAFLMMALALIFIYLVLSAQFESFIDPLIILISVPLAMFGAFLCLAIINKGNAAGLWEITGSWNIYTQIGAVTLVGLISKHGILIVEFANQLRGKGLNKRDAVLQSASQRLRPILMTTGAMVLGAVPLAIASGAGAEARHQIGWVIVGGMSFGTIFTLFVVPVVYLLLAGRHEKAAATANVAALAEPASS